MANENLHIDPETNLPRPIYLIATSGEILVMRPTAMDKYDKLYFKQKFEPGQKMDDSHARRIKHVTLTKSTVMELWPELIKNQGYKYM